MQPPSGCLDLDTPARQICGVCVGQYRTSHTCITTKKRYVLPGTISFNGILLPETAANACLFRSVCSKTCESELTCFDVYQWQITSATCRPPGSCMHPTRIPGKEQQPSSNARATRVQSCRKECHPMARCMWRTRKCWTSQCTR